MNRYIATLCLAGTAVLGCGAFCETAAAAEISLAETNQSTRVSESGALDHYTLTLSQAPKVPVTISLTPSNSQITVNPPSVSFGPLDALSRTITVSAVNDRVAGDPGQSPDPDPGTSVITHTVSTADPDYQAWVGSDKVRSVTVDIADDDLKVVVSKTEASVTEGVGKDSYTLSLSGQPSADVSIRIVSHRERTGSTPYTQVQPATVLFTPLDYEPRTVTLTAIDDLAANGQRSERLLHEVSSTDEAYNLAVVAAVNVTIADNDVAGVHVHPKLLEVNEGVGPGGRYTIKLNSRPSSDVTVTMDGGTQLTTDPRSLTFTPDNWDIPQPVVVRAVADGLSEDDHAATVAHHSSSRDSSYCSVCIKVDGVTVAITDLDAPALLVSPAAYDPRSTEGGTSAVYTLRLSKRPLADVWVDVIAGDQLVATPSQLRFTAANFSELQPVKLDAFDDLVVESERAAIVAHELRSGDLSYHERRSNSVTVTVVDNDARGLAIDESAGGTAVVEGGTPSRYALRLTARPDADVVVTLAPSDAGIEVDPGVVTFSPDNFWLAKEIKVLAPDDDARAEPDRLVTIAHSIASADPGYRAVVPGSVSVTLSDNDIPGVSVHEVGGPIAVGEGGASGAYEIVLRSQPEADVTIQIDAGAQLQVEPVTVTFGPDDYAVPRTIEVSAVDDAVAEGAHTGAISHAAASDDPAYEGIGVPGIVAAIEDNDEPGLQLVATAPLRVTEGGQPATYALALMSQPIADVTVVIDAGQQLVAEPAGLVFTAENWDQPQAITLRAVNDAAVESRREVDVVHRAEGPDTTYTGITASLPVTVDDNDVAPSGGGGALSALGLAMLLLGARRRIRQRG